MLKHTPSSFPFRDSNTLTAEQSKIIKVAEAGHNILVTGQAGTGKSTLVHALQKDLRRKGRQVAIVCSSGIAGTVYLRDGTTASTAHAFYGLHTADLSANMVVERSVANNLVCERAREADTFIWDEISMTSRRIKFTSFYHLTANQKYLFAGKQVILVRDFLQLRHVANFFDLGRFVFDSPLFMKSIPHHAGSAVSKKSSFGYRGHTKMAARRQHFSREEVIEQVLVESEQTKEDEVSLNDILETSISNFTALWRSISNYTHVREEAHQLMLNVYHRHEVGVHGMDKSLMSSLPAWPMITSEVLIWLNRIRRRMLANPKASNPWTIEVKRDLPQEIVEVLVKSVQGAHSAFGVSVEDNVIKYTKKNRLLRDFSKFCGIPQSEVANKLKKSSGRNRKGFKAEVLASREKPFSICYNCKRKQLTLVCNYGC